MKTKLNIKLIKSVSELEELIEDYKGNLVQLIKDLNVVLNEEEKETIIELFEELELGVRLCSNCKNLFICGYVIYDGDFYACSEECLAQVIHDEGLEDELVDFYETDFSEVNENGVELTYASNKDTFNQWLDEYMAEKKVDLSKYIKNIMDVHVTVADAIAEIKDWPLYSQMRAKKQFVLGEIKGDDTMMGFTKIVNDRPFDFLF